MELEYIREVEKQFNTAWTKAVVKQFPSKEEDMLFSVYSALKKLREMKEAEVTEDGRE